MPGHSGVGEAIPIRADLNKSRKKVLNLPGMGTIVFILGFLFVTI